MHLFIYINNNYCDGVNVINDDFSYCYYYFIHIMIKFLLFLMLYFPIYLNSISIHFPCFQLNFKLKILILYLQFYKQVLIF